MEYQKVVDLSMDQAISPGHYFVFYGLPDCFNGKVPACHVDVLRAGDDIVQGVWVGQNSTLGFVRRCEDLSTPVPRWDEWVKMTPVLDFILPEGSTAHIVEDALLELVPRQKGESGTFPFTGWYILRYSDDTSQAVLALAGDRFDYDYDGINRIFYAQQEYLDG